MTILEALEHVLVEMKLTYDEAFARAGTKATLIKAIHFNGHRRDLEAIYLRLQAVDGDATKELNP